MAEYNGTILELKSVSRRYGAFKLENLSIALPYGGVLGIIGAGNAGKTTILKLILDLIASDGGSIEVFGMDNLTQGAAIRERIGVTFDDGCLPLEMKAGEVGRMLARIYKNWNADKFGDYLRMLEIPAKDLIKKMPRSTRTKLAVAAALSHEAELLLLDEPAAPFDMLSRGLVMGAIGNYLKRDGRRSALLTSPTGGDIERLCDTLLLLDHGRVLYCGARDALRAQYPDKKMEEILAELSKEAAK